MLEVKLIRATTDSLRCPVSEAFVCGWFGLGVAFWEDFSEVLFYSWLSFFVIFQIYSFTGSWFSLIFSSTVLDLTLSSPGSFSSESELSDALSMFSSIAAVFECIGCSFVLPVLRVRVLLKKFMKVMKT